MIGKIKNHKNKMEEESSKKKENKVHFDPDVIAEWNDVCQFCRYNHKGKDCKEKQCHNPECGRSFFGPFRFKCKRCEDVLECHLCGNEEKCCYYIKTMVLCKSCFVHYHPWVGSYPVYHPAVTDKFK